MTTYIIQSEIIGPWENYSHLLIDTASQQAVIFDPAWDATRIIQRLQKNNVTLQAIWLTHAHHDHVNAIEALRAHYPVPILLAQTEIDFLKQYPDGIHPFGQIPQDTQALQDGDILSIGQTSVRFMLTPGHSPGCGCFVLSDDCITGDTLFINGCGRADFPGSNPEQLYQSLQKIIAHVPHHVRLHTGHAYGEPADDTLANQLKTNPYLQPHHLKSFVDYRMSH